MSLSKNHHVKRAKEVFEKTARYYIYSPPFSYAFSTTESKFVLSTIRSFDLPDDAWLYLDSQRKRDMKQKVSPCDFPSNYVNEAVSAVLGIIVANELGLNKLAVRYQGEGNLTHDFGKGSERHKIIPDEIIYKPGELTEEEKRIMEMHPEMTVKKQKECGMKNQIHHLCGLEHQMYFIDAPPGSKYSGYPKKTNKKDQPSIYGQIAAIADCTESMALGRPYRNNLESKMGSVDLAIKQLKKWSNPENPNGVQFNPYLAKLMINFLKRIPHNT